MDTDRIASFVAAAEAGSLSRAAERLSQQLSSVSRHVADLEAELGARLFERTGRGVRLTEAGEHFLERGRAILRELEAARAEARGTRRKEPTTLRLSAPPDLAQGLFPAALTSLAARHPELTLESHSELRRVSVVEEAYDAVVRLGPLAPSDLIATRLGASSLHLVAPPGHEVKTLRELEGRDVVLLGNAPREAPATVRGRKVKLSLRGRFRVGSFAEAAELAVRGERLALVPALVAAPFVDTGRLVRAARWLQLPRIECHLLRTQRHRGSRVLDDLAELLTAGLAAAEARVR